MNYSQQKLYVGVKPGAAALSVHISEIMLNLTITKAVTAAYITGRTIIARYITERKVQSKLSSGHEQT